VTQRFDGSSGSVTVSAGFPLKPGTLFPADVTAKKVKVTVSGVEQAIFCGPLYGLWADGSLHSILIQYVYNIPDASAITSEVTLGVVRTTTDISETVVTNANLTAHARLLPSSPTYLCQTECTLQPLIADSAETVNDKAWYTTKMDTKYSLAAVSGAAFDMFAAAPSEYERGRTLAAHWCRTGTVKYHKEMILRMQDYMRYCTPGKNLSNHTDVNTDLMTVNSGDSGRASLSEAHTVEWMSLGVLYWLTGWGQVWRTLNFQLTEACYKMTSDAIANADGGWLQYGYAQRANTCTPFGTGGGWGLMVMGYLFECTHSFSGNVSGYPGFSITYSTHLARVMGALAANQISGASVGNVLDGLVGTHKTCSDNDGLGATGQFFNFQLAVLAEYLMLYYRYVAEDSRIPTWLTTLGALVIAQQRLANAADIAFGLPSDIYVMPYIVRQVPTDEGSGRAGDAWTHPMFVSLFGWLYSYTASATYTTWMDRCLHSYRDFQLTYSYKQFEEIFGLGNAGPAYRQGASYRGPVVPAITQPPAH
jgi:hypothetical protein